MARRVQTEDDSADRWEAALEAVDKHDRRIYLEYTSGHNIRCARGFGEHHAQVARE